MHDNNYNCTISVKEVQSVNQSKKVGRPRSENPRDFRIQVRFTEDEYKLLMDCAERHNMTITQIVRKGAGDLAKSWK